MVMQPPNRTQPPMTLPTGQQQMLRANSVNAPNPAAAATAALPIAVPSMPAVTPAAPVGSLAGAAQSMLALGRPQGQTQGVPVPLPAQQPPQTPAGVQGMPGAMQIPQLAAIMQQVASARQAAQPGAERAILQSMTQPQIQPMPSLGQLIQGQSAQAPNRATTAISTSPDGLVRRQGQGGI